MVMGVVSHNPDVLAGPLWASISLCIKCLPEIAVSGPQLLLWELDSHSSPWRQVRTVFIRQMGKWRPRVPQRLKMYCRQSQKCTLPAALFGVLTGALVFNEESALGLSGHWLLRERSWVGSHGGQKQTVGEEMCGLGNRAGRDKAQKGKRWSGGRRQVSMLNSKMCFSQPTCSHIVCLSPT